MAENKDFTPQEYEDLIKELMNENNSLKKRITELENRDQRFEVQEEPIKEVPIPVIEPETHEPVILVEEPVEQHKEDVISKSIFSPPVTPLEMGKGQIVQGVSRRECPKCGNNSKPLIRETIDKTHLISDYPRMYAKKYHCGDCGVEWRVPVEM
jgi:hypothetical protein